MHDPVNSPIHYASGPIECIEAMEASMSPEAFKGFLKGNIQKYVWRYEAKGGVESLQKAQWYLNRLIATVEAEEARKQAIYDAVKDVLAMEEKVNYDPDDYMASGCPDGFCPMPGTRQGPSEPFFQPVN
jgi:hypothetical protein